MKKSIVFLINGLGIEKPNSYSISLEQSMPHFARTMETCYSTSAIINSLEYRSAYQSFYLGDTYRLELDYIKENILNSSIQNNPVYQQFQKDILVQNSKLHIFVEPTNGKIVELINDFVSFLSLYSDKAIYLHLILPQQTTNEYQKLIDIVNYIKYHISTHITVGFVIGKEFYPEEMSKEEMKTAEKLLFYCSAERWSDTDKKLINLKESNVRPCMVPGFCALNTCNIEQGDTILFFNSNRTTYDKFIHAIYANAVEVFKTEEYSLPTYSLIQLDSKYNIPSFSNNVEYKNCLSNIMERNQKKALIIADSKYIPLINFFANGMNYVNNPNIQFMNSDFSYLSKHKNMVQIIDESEFDFIIFDFHMDVSKTINDLKAQLEKIDAILGDIAELSMNKHSLWITSLYGLKKEMPLANYNTEIVVLDYEMQIPIFFFDYSYLRSKYFLKPGETHDILETAVKCIADDSELYSLLVTKGILPNLLGKK